MKARFLLVDISLHGNCKVSWVIRHCVAELIKGTKALCQLFFHYSETEE